MVLALKCAERMGLHARCLASGPGHAWLLSLNRGRQFTTGLVSKASLFGDEEFNMQVQALKPSTNSSARFV